MFGRRMGAVSWIFDDSPLQSGRPAANVGCRSEPAVENERGALCCSTISAPKKAQRSWHFRRLNTFSTIFVKTTLSSRAGTRSRSAGPATYPRLVGIASLRTSDPFTNRSSNHDEEFLCRKLYANAHRLWGPRILGRVLLRKQGFGLEFCQQPCVGVA